ncbi:HNH endonuclease [Nocardioides sp.]|uniref:HNH endonuclease n=1 Tax=Nocardioides sp. TaxID=35761 RepID=UPI002CE6BAE4|nr:DUF222 domain-containing protein [Nocardioides sp.]HXH77142.1 DUF222 domain-containing protein [Nocardioides sp.]
MFDTFHASAPEPPSGGAAGVLSARNLESWADGLSSTIEGVSDLDDAERIDAVRALERLACVVTAAQARLASDLDASQRAEQEAAGVPVARRGRGVVEQVALARRESPHRGRQHLGLAKIVPSELPHTWTAWRTGRITEWKATIVARETACLTLEDRLTVDQIVAGSPDGAQSIESIGERELAGACLKEVARLDAAALVVRRRRAESERRVTLRPAPDTMTYLTALLPVKDGVAVLAALTRAADSARAAGDERGKGQVMADTLVAQVFSAADGDVSAPQVSLGLIMSDTALFGGSDDPAQLEGFGPIPAELAREVMTDACDRDEAIWLRRLYTSPTTGELVSMDATGRFFRGSLARFIRLRDQVCRTPWCDAPVRHVDHLQTHADGGSTSARNGQGLCESCNYAKDAPRWRARPQPDGSIAVTLPTGHQHRTRPPPLVTIRKHHVPALRVDYVLVV